MVNKTQFYKTKVALAVVLSLGLAACGDSDGDANTSNNQSQTDSTQNTVGNQDNLSVSVSGVVVDTNNNGVPGASVTLAGVTVTTDDYGTYVFDSVDVTNVAGVNNEGGESDDSVGAALTIIISPSADYLGGTLTITPEAQVNNTGGQGSGQSGGNSDVTIQTFISGQSYGAGKAVVPMLSAKITGYLTDCTVTTHDSVLEGVTVAADITALGTTATNTATPGSSFELSVPSPSTTTDEDGKWTLTLPADSVSNILVDGWGPDGIVTVNDLAETNVIITGQTSNNEQITENVGIFAVCPFATPDTDIPNVAPTVDSVSDYYDVDVIVDGPDFGDTAGDFYNTHATTDANNGAGVDNTANDTNATDRHYGVIKEGVVNNFTITFSEALVDLEEVDLVVTLNNEAAPAGTVITLAADKASALITFPEDLEEQDLIDFFLPQWQAVDADGAGVVSEGENYIDLGLELEDATKVGTYVRVSFCIFSRPDHDEAGITLIEQITDADADEDGTFNALSDYSSSFADNIADTTTIEQLNGQSFTDNRLDALAEEILATTDGGTGSEVAFDVDDARVSYEDKAGSVVVVADDTGTVGTLADGVFEVANTEDDTELTATASNIFGVVKTTSTLSIFDKIAPTTVLQENYGITASSAPKDGIPMVTSASTSGVAFGNGGEATDGTPAVAGTVGNPIIYIQPRHLVARDATLATAVRGEEFDALNEDLDDRLATGENPNVLGDFANRSVYDSTAFAGWDAQSQRIGVAMSETVSVITGSTLGTADVSTDITDPTAFNAVTLNVDGTGSTNGSVDLVAVNVADVVNLANVDNGGVLSFANVIQDAASTPNVALPGLGSVGGANAQVVFQDAFAPMVESAEWNGTTFTIVFNEDVAVPTGTDDIDLWLMAATDTAAAAKVAINLNAAEDDVDAEGYFTYDSNTFTLVVNVSTGIEPLFLGSASADEEHFYNDDIANSTAEEQHAILNWDSLADTNGNDWLEYNGGVVANGIEAGDADLSNNANRWEVNAPVFLAVNTLGQLDVDLDFDNTTYDKRTINAIVNSDDQVTLVLTSTYALDIDATFDDTADVSINGLTNAAVAASTSGLVLSAAAVEFLLDEADFTFGAGLSSGFVSKDRMTITFNIVVGGGATPLATDLIEAGDTVSIDNAALITPNQATDILSRDDAIQQLIFN